MGREAGGVTIAVFMSLVLGPAKVQAVVGVVLVMLMRKAFRELKGATNSVQIPGERS